jgi:hypothetical protein
MHSTLENRHLDQATCGHAKSSSVEQPGAATYIEHPEDGGRQAL